MMAPEADKAEAFEDEEERKTFMDEEERKTFIDDLTRSLLTESSFWKTLKAACSSSWPITLPQFGFSEFNGSSSEETSSIMRQFERAAPRRTRPIGRRGWAFIAIGVLSLVWLRRDVQVTEPYTVSTAPKEVVNLVRQGDGEPPSPREMIGSWQGTVWIPPTPWRLFTTKELQTLYANHNILWLGDSLARRVSLTWYSLLKAEDPTNVGYKALTHPTIIDATKWDDRYECPLLVNSTHRPKICRNESPHSLLYVKQNCYSQIAKFMREEIQRAEVLLPDAVDLVVVAAGAWDIDVGFQCEVFDRTKLPGRVTAVLRAVNDWSTARQVRVVWRTAGFSDWPKYVDMYQKFNDMIMDTIDSFENPLFTYVNFGGMVRPRSIGKDRIAGDNKAHFGLEPRMGLIQMLTNHLLDVGYFATAHDESLSELSRWRQSLR